MEKKYNNPTWPLETRHGGRSGAENNSSFQHQVWKIKIGSRSSRIIQRSKTNISKLDPSSHRKGKSTLVGAISIVSGQSGPRPHAPSQGQGMWSIKGDNSVIFQDIDFKLWTHIPVNELFNMNSNFLKILKISKNLPKSQNLEKR